jgi:hypothetical protein
MRQAYQDFRCATFACVRSGAVAFILALFCAAAQQYKDMATAMSERKSYL